MEKVRPAQTIQKHLILVPPRSGKTSIAKDLAKSAGWIICDLDEDIKLHEEHKEYEEAVKAGLFAKADILYYEMAERVYKDVRSRCRKHKVKAVFLSSCFRVARLFSPDAVVALCSDAESFETRLASLPMGDRDGLRRARQLFLDALPSREFAVSFHTLEELITAVRGRLHIRYSL